MGVDTRMLVKVSGDIADNELLLLSYRICEAFEHDNFGVNREHGYRALEKIDVFEQDGDDIIPQPGETFVKVNLWVRYYGIGYERGPLPLIIAVAEWLEHNVPDGRVYYGGDSSGICADPFDKDARATLMQHFCKYGHEPYEMFFNGKGESVPVCDFCQHNMVSFGGGAAFSFWRCAGCGYAGKFARTGEFIEVMDNN